MSLFYPNDFDEDDPLYELGAEVLSYALDEYGAAVHRTVSPDDSWFIVRTTDHVANEWRSIHPTLALALAYLAVVDFCHLAGVTVTARDRFTGFAEAFVRAATWTRPEEDP